MIKFLIKIPVFKRLIPSLGIRILKLLNINRKYFDINGIKMFLDFLDPIDREIILNKKYEEDSVKFFEKKINLYSFSNFIDIGANSGYYSFYFAKKFRQLKVNSFEPNIDAYYKFNRTLKVNSFKNIKIFNFGLSNLTKKVKMITWFKHGYAKTNSMIFDSAINTNNSKIFNAILYPGDKILNFRKKKLAIKIDVEGHEIKVLQGLIKNFEHNKCLMLIEIGKHKFNLVDKFLRKNNFKKIWKSNNRLDYFYSNF